MAGNVRPLEDLLVDQATLHGNHRPATGKRQSPPGQGEETEKADEDSPALGGVPASYWLDLKGYDPVAEAKKLGLPMLILQGERDYQVTMADFALWKAGLGNSKGVVMKCYPALNHLFVAGKARASRPNTAGRGMWRRR